MMRTFDAPARRRATARPGGRGFTIVEIVLSAFVLTVTVLGVAASVATSGGMGDRSREEMRARRAAQAWLADVQSRKFSTVGYTMHGAAFDVPGLHPTDDDTDGRVGQVVFSAGPLPDTYYVDVVVKWDGRHGEREIRSRVVLSNVNAESGVPPTMAELKVAAEARLTAPATLRDVLKLGEMLLQEQPGERWSDALALSMENVTEAQLLLNTTPVELDRVVTEIETAIANLQEAMQSGFDTSTGEGMIQDLTGVATALGVG